MTGDDGKISDYMFRTAEMIIRVAEVVDEERSRQFISEILSGRRIYVTGAGRSGLVAKAFAIRLMHLGFPCYVIGETITPALEGGSASSPQIQNHRQPGLLIRSLISVNLQGIPVIFPRSTRSGRSPASTGRSRFRSGGDRHLRWWRSPIPMRSSPH